MESSAIPMQVEVVNDHKGLVVTGYITAVFLPLLGLILGIVVATRPNTPASRNGWKIITLSVVAWIAWIIVVVAIAAAASHSTGYYTYQ
jgi:hypothetical protein